MKLAELSNMAYKLASNYLVKYGRSECRLIINGVPCLITK